MRRTISPSTSHILPELVETLRIARPEDVRRAAKEIRDLPDNVWLALRVLTLDGDSLFLLRNFLLANEKFAAEMPDERTLVLRQER